jgi:hypothetical protein
LERPKNIKPVRYKALSLRDKRKGLGEAMVDDWIKFKPVILLIKSRLAI